MSPILSDARDRIARQFGESDAAVALAGIAKGELQLCISDDWLFTWKRVSESELYLCNAVGDFSAIWADIYAKAKNEGYKRITCHSLRHRAFVRRLSALGYTAKAEESESGPAFCIWEIK